MTLGLKRFRNPPSGSSPGAVSHENNHEPRGAVVRRLSALLALSLIAVSCGLATRTRTMFGGTLPLHVTVGPEANQRSAVAVAVVVVYQRPVLDKLVALSARDWFQHHQQLQRDYPGSFHAWSWEWVPGQAVADQDLRYETGAKAGVVFADYLTPGAHRAVIDPHKPLRLTLGRTDFAVAPES